MKKNAMLLLLTLLAVSCSGKKSTEKKKIVDLPPGNTMQKKVELKSVKTNEKPVKTMKESLTELDKVKKILASFVPTELKYEKSDLPENLRPLLKKLIEAARIMDEIFLIQVNRKNPEIRKEILEKVKSDSDYKSVLDLFDIMAGPWDRLNHNKPFYGKKLKTPGAGFYDTKLTRKEFNLHLATLEQALKTEKDAREKSRIVRELEGLKSLYTVIDRINGKYIFTPYSRAYREQLSKAANILEEAAKLSVEPTMKKFLMSRANAFRDDKYRSSDEDWVELKGKIEFVIGPYEVYEDGLMGYKASFESFITLVDSKYTARLESIRKFMKDMDTNLPYDHKLGQNKGANRPLKVVNELYTAGDTKAGVQTLAFVLPNDEDVRRKKGFKIVLLKNVAHAKFDKILIPIAKQLISDAQIEKITFDSFFTHTLVHEVTHSLGPGIIKADGKETEVRNILKDLYSHLEEAKADIGGLLGVEFLAGKKVLPPEAVNQSYTTFIASIFRSIRFGANEAHGKANLMAFNYFLKARAITFDSKIEKFTIDYRKISAASREFVKELLEVYTSGKYEKAKEFVEKWGSIPHVLKTALKKLSHIPVDIRPIYPLVKELNL
ncbi:MAG: peptidase [Deltaproteobacteria bacterium]|nr:peptidase [Deltaproteobacteria bacterium]